MKKRLRKAVIFVNTFGAAGYLLITLAWVLCGGAVVWIGMQSSAVTSPVDTSVQAEPFAVANNGAVILKIIAYSITVAMVVTTLALLLILPYLIGKWSARLVRYTMREFHIPIYRRSLFFTKSLFAVVPLVGFIVISAMYVPADMAVPALHAASIFLSVGGILCFIIQLITARNLSISVKDMW